MLLTRVTSDPVTAYAVVILHIAEDKSVGLQTKRKKIHVQKRSVVIAFRGFHNYCYEYYKRHIEHALVVTRENCLEPIIHCSATCNVIVVIRFASKNTKSCHPLPTCILSNSVLNMHNNKTQYTTIPIWS